MRNGADGRGLRIKHFESEASEHAVAEARPSNFTLLSSESWRTRMEQPAPPPLRVNGPPGEYCRV